MVTGAILAGGKSLRYGRNKALEVFEGERLIDRAVAFLKRECSPVIVVANDLSLYRNVGATLVRDIMPDQGPLGGIFSALVFSPNEWVFARATDMPFFVPHLLQSMLENRAGYDVVVPVSNGYYEPLLALYSRRCLPYMATLLEGRDRRLSAFYENVRVRKFEEEEWRTVDPGGVSFKNINVPNDWDNVR